MIVRSSIGRPSPNMNCHSLSLVTARDSDTGPSGVRPRQHERSRIDRFGADLVEASAHVGRGEREAGIQRLAEDVADVGDALQVRRLRAQYEVPRSSPRFRPGMLTGPPSVNVS